MCGNRRRRQPRKHGTTTSIECHLKYHMKTWTRLFSIQKKALSICVKGTNMWNALSSDIKLSRNVNAFKKMLKALLLENYKF